MNEPTTQWLTAAECASRTGLTVRALRVYEDYGLITPGRSAAGWRRYGAVELLKLNAIGLLKVLGLTLTQMRDVMRTPQAPSLRQLLELQLGTWRHRLTEAERGLAVAEAALQRLKMSRSLSVEELCSLIRSFEMSSINADTTASIADEPVTLDTTMLDRYVGCYLRNPALGVSTVTRKDTKLFLESIGQPPIELEPTGEAEFSVRAFDLVLRFEEIEGGAAKRIAIQQRNITLQLVRIDADSAERIKQALAERIKSGIPIPGSEQAVRRMIDSVRSGNPNYDEMSPEFAELMRTRMPLYQTMGQYLGAIVSMEFSGISNQGWDMYKIQREHGPQRYSIALGDDGKIYGAAIFV
jgi:DNA-binding transcriptional MerR regulator